MGPFRGTRTEDPIEAPTEAPVKVPEEALERLPWRPPQNLPNGFSKYIFLKGYLNR